jgi:hypothetical protein
MADVFEFKESSAGKAALFRMKSFALKAAA